ncbi:MAG: helix-turn-helix transcriptional regulator, partial [Acidobacteriaceae bacterium]|nr:helix-turn-helix transcriptional regulator [Acidobacteriaceae bacterium]
IRQASGEELQVTQGALYPALHRLEQQGWITAEWRKSETGREAKFYRLSAAGKVQLEKELAEWERLSNAIALVIAAV